MRALNNALDAGVLLFQEVLKIFTSFFLKKNNNLIITVESKDRRQDSTAATSPMHAVAGAMFFALFRRFDDPT